MELEVLTNETTNPPTADGQESGELHITIPHEQETESLLKPIKQEHLLVQSEISTLKILPPYIIKIITEYNEMTVQQKNMVILRHWFDKTTQNNRSVNRIVYSLTASTCISISMLITIESWPNAERYLDTKILLGIVAIIVSSLNFCYLLCASGILNEYTSDSSDLKARLELPLNEIEPSEYRVTLNQVRDYLREFKEVYRASSHRKSEYDLYATLIFSVISQILALSFGIVAVCRFPNAFAFETTVIASSSLGIALGSYGFYKNNKNNSQRDKDLEIIDSNSPDFSLLTSKGT